MAAASSKLLVDAQPCAAGVFSAVRARPIGSARLEPRAHEETDDRRCPAQPSGRYSSVTLAWMLAVHTRSHKQAADGEYEGGFGGGDKVRRKILGRGQILIRSRCPSPVGFADILSP